MFKKITLFALLGSLGTTSTYANLGDLPLEVLDHILKHTGLPEMLTLRKTSKHLQSAVDCPKFWDLYTFGLIECNGEINGWLTDSKTSPCRKVELEKISALTLPIHTLKVYNLGEKRLAELLRKVNLANLTSLTLSGSNLGEIGTQALTESLEKLKNLTQFNVSGTSLQKVEAQVLTESLANLENLTDFNLHGNNLGALGAQDLQALMKSLGKLKRLTILDLSGNYIGDPAVQPLTESLEKLENLAELVVHCHRFSYPFLEALLKKRPRRIRVYY